MSDNCLFNFEKLEITKPIRLIELFGGIGSQAMALRDIGAKFEHYRLVEFDKYAIKSYNAIHGTAFETMDIRNVHADDLGITECNKYTYIMTYSFPCTDLSVAGKMKGMSRKDWEEGKATRSGLLWEVERILKELPKEQLPQILLMENVPQVHAEKNIQEFESWLQFLRGKGYHNFWEDLNAKDYGIPQNRERCFCVSILSDEFVEFDFPKSEKLTLLMKDMLESNVEENYYINTEKAKKLIKQLSESGVLENSMTGQTDRQEVKIIGRMDNSIDHTFESTNRVYDKNGIFPTLSTCQGGDRQPKIIEEAKIKKVGQISTDKSQCGTVVSETGLSPTLSAGTHGYANAHIYVHMVGRNPDNPKSRKSGLPTEQMIEPNAEGLCGTLTTVQKDNMVLEKKNIIYDDYNSNIPEDQECIGTITTTCGSPTMRNGKKIIEESQGVETQYRIRKLTPRECWRLMGYTDTDFDRAAKVNSNTQLYKQAGNAIVKQVLMAIFRSMNIKKI